MKRLRLAVVGCGDIAGFTALVARLIPQIRLTACCDTDLNRAQRFARRNRIPEVSADYDEMLDGGDAYDAVYLAVPHRLHYEMIGAAAKRGKHVLVEKPVTRTLEEGRKLLAYTAGIRIGVNYQYRYGRACYALARAAQAGALGNIHSIRINVPWHRDGDYFTGAPWHKTWADAGGGTLITQGSHFLDIALWALGERPVSAMGYVASPGFDVEVDTLTHGIVETESGALISIASTMAAATEQAVTIEVYGERGTARYRDRPLPSLRVSGTSVRRRRPPGLGVHALQRSLAGFADWVLANKPYLIPVDASLPVLAAVDGIYCSARSGRRETIEI